MKTFIHTVTTFLCGVLVGGLALAAYVNMAAPGVLPYSNAAAYTRPAPVKVDRCAGDEVTGEPDQGPCVWDARHQGNGEGKSLLITKRERLVYIRHSRAHCLVRWHIAGLCKPVKIPPPIVWS